MKFWGLVVLLVLMAFSVKAENSLLIGEDDMMVALKKEFAERGVDENIEIEIFGGQTSFAIENARVFKIMIAKLKYDAEQNKFSAGAEIFADGQPYAKTTLSGKYYTMGEAWVPVTTIDKGEILTADMLKKTPMRQNRLKTMYVIEKAKLLDKQAKKVLKEGRLISERDIGEVILIKKGTVVTSIYRTKGMQITAKAEAMEDGSKGQRIEVMNTKSGKKFYAEVKDTDTVEIDAE